MVSTFLFMGKENALSSKYLCKQLNMTPRQLTLAIEAERRSGQAICATTGRNPGYYIAANKQEMEEYCLKLKNRAIEIFKTRKACQETIQNL